MVISVFLCFSLVTINRRTLYDSVILRQDYGIIPRDISFVTRNRQTSYDTGILRQDYGMIRDFSMNRLGHYLGSTVFEMDRNGNISDFKLYLQFLVYENSYIKMKQKRIFDGKSNRNSTLCPISNV